MAVLILKSGEQVLVDEQDAHLLNQYTWRKHKGSKHYYVARKNPKGLKPSNVLLHREIMNAPDGWFVDHINHDTFDNRRENLRLATAEENSANCRPKREETKGVRARGGRWQAYIHPQSTGYINLGMFDTKDEAAQAYNVAATIAWGEFAIMNEVPEDTKPVTLKEQAVKQLESVQAMIQEQWMQLRKGRDSE